MKLWQAIKPLETTLSFMNTGAHPDDERSDLLAYLSRGLGVRTASVIANRGEGGQNEIGDELGNALGIIRSRELIEASKVTGVDLFMLSQTPNDDIYDFGFSKSPKETLEKWGEEVTYERLIRLIREYKPDIIYPSFRDVDTQHGHHRAINQLTLKAFKDAADPAIFPEQLQQGITTWQVKKLYLPAETKEQTTTSIEVGEFDPILGITYPQLGEESRYLHKSQGMGRDIAAGPRKVNLQLVQSTVNEAGKENSLFDGLAYNFEDISKQLDSIENSLRGDLIQLQRNLEELISQYPNSASILTKSHDLLGEVSNLKQKVDHSKLDQDTKQELLFKLTVKEKQLAYVSEAASALVVDIAVSNPVLVRNGETSVKFRVYNGGAVQLNRVKLDLNLPDGWEIDGTPTIKNLKHQQMMEATFHIKVPSDAPYFQPYDTEVIQPVVTYAVNQVEISRTITPETTVAVVPQLGITIDQEQLAVNSANVPEEIPVRVSLKNFAAKETTANVTLQVPKGWSVSPEVQPVAFHRQDEIRALEFIVKPSEQVVEGNFNIKAIAEINGEKLQSTVQTIEYDHIGTTYYIYPSEVKGVAFNLQIPIGLKVGYVESGFDQLADELKNIGVDITKLSSNDLKFGDLSEYDTIVIGIRAYLSREDLRESNERLLNYAKNGGHLVVQYHKPWDQWDSETTAPYKLVIGKPSIRWRVTDEASAVNMLKPEHTLFQWPNKITDKDWENWVQDRALYFPMEWDSKYETFVSMADPNEEPFDGGILMAEYGEGTYLYTNLVWYRQIQSQVPGSYRIFTNLISYPLRE